jgi:CspA family cold shock protein
MHDANSLTGIEGLVKWFDPRKGFGFIVGPSGQDIFVHFSVIQGDGFRVLKDGSSVHYDAQLTDKGWRATRASRVEDVRVTQSTAMAEEKKATPRSPRGE